MDTEAASQVHEMGDRKHRSRHPRVREIAIVLGLKALVLLALYVAFFGPANRPQITPEGVGTMLFDAASPPSERSGGDV